MLHFYHPNKANKGSACSFWYSQRDDSVFATLLKQSGWDAKNQNGVFKGSLDDPTKKTNIKLGQVECAAILDCIEKGRPFNSFHDGDPLTKSIGFVPWKNDDGGLRGYTFSISVTNKQDTTQKNSFFIGLTPAEGRLVREFLIHILHLQFSNSDKVRKERTGQQVSYVPTTKDDTKKGDILE